MMLGYRCANSQMTIAVGADHRIERRRRGRDDPDRRRGPHQDGLPGRGARRATPCAWRRRWPTTPRAACPSRELSDRCDRTLDRAARHGVAHYLEEQRDWFARFWEAADVEIEDDGASSRRSASTCSQLAQASARADQQGVPAKGVTGSGYEGHYFWDAEVYVAPFLSYTQPDVARNLLHFRTRMLPGGPAPGARDGPEPARCSRGARSTARRPRRTTPRAPRRCTSTPTSPTRWCSTSPPPATGLPGPRRDRHPRRDLADVGRARLLAQQRHARRSTSTASPGPTSTPPS